MNLNSLYSCIPVFPPCFPKYYKYYSKTCITLQHVRWNVTRFEEFFAKLFKAKGSALGCDGRRHSVKPSVHILLKIQKMEAILMLSFIKVIGRPLYTKPHYLFVQCTANPCHAVRTDSLVQAETTVIIHFNPMNVKQSNRAKYSKKQFHQIN